MNFGKILICLILEIKVHVIIYNQMNHKSQDARTWLPTKVISYSKVKIPELTYEHKCFHF